MAYVDLVATGLTPVVGGATYNFAYDTPVAADGSPNITHIGFQGDFTFTAAPAMQTSLGRLISNFRIKVGGTEVLNFNDPAAAAGEATPSNLSILAQKVGGVDAVMGGGGTGDGNSATSLNQLGELSLPFGLDASKSHRVNVEITLLDESTWIATAGDLVPATTEFNMVHYYGKSSDATLYGSRQDFTLTAGATRTITVYGKSGWEMLGVCAINDSDADQLDSIRVNNGSFRALSPNQWRILDSTYSNGIQTVGAAPAASYNTRVMTLSRDGFIFLDLKRITEGTDISMAVDCNTGTTYSFFPVWVANLNSRTSKPPSQQNMTVTNTSDNVEAESQY